MFEVIDLSREIFSGMPVFRGLPAVNMTIHQSHEQLDGIGNRAVISPAMNLFHFGEHTGTDVDAILRLLAYRSKYMVSRAHPCGPLLCSSLEQNQFTNTYDHRAAKPQPDQLDLGGKTVW
jgi:hypothetical protein